MNIFLDPSPLRTIALKLIRKYQIGSFEQRAKIGALRVYPHYGYLVYHSAKLAKKLGHRRISVIEFGVAGGQGLMALRNHTREISKLLNIEIDIYGFDSGEGLPAPEDYRDLPFYWERGFFKMDIEELKRHVPEAKLIIGDVHNTVKTFLSLESPAPIAAIMFDLDYYSATKSALEIFLGHERYLLPRIFCYFDDIMGTEECLTSEYTGQRLAIEEFNSQHQYKKIDHLYYLSGRVSLNPKYQRMRAFHDFHHSMYGTFVGPENQQQPL